MSLNSNCFAVQGTMEPRTIDDLHPPTIHDTWMDSDSESGLVSVIVPTYNRAHFLPDAFRSISQQTYRPIELLVVDDGSTDNTAEVVESFSQDVRSEERLQLRYFRQENHGAPTARNRGLIELRGEFIQFMDSDDVLHPQKLEVQTHILTRHSDLDHTWADFHWAHGADFEPFGPAHRTEYEPGEVESNIDFRSSTPAEVWSGLYRREACRRIGPWNETLGRWQDVEYNFRFDCLSPATARSEAKLYKMRSHDTGRILDAKRDTDGIDKGLHTLRVIENEAGRLDAENIPENYRLDGLYLHLLQLGLETGGHEQISEIFDGVARHGKNRFRQYAVRGLEVLHDALGPRVAGFVLQAYSRLRGAV